MGKALRAEDVKRWQDIPNIGPAMAADFRALGFEHPGQLAGLDPYALYERINALSGVRHDPCVCDTYIAAVRFMEGSPPHPWWHYTPERKRHFARTVR